MPITMKMRLEALGVSYLIYQPILFKRHFSIKSVDIQSVEWLTVFKRISNYTFLKSRFNVGLGSDADRLIEKDRPGL